MTDGLIPSEPPPEPCPEPNPVEPVTYMVPRPKRRLPPGPYSKSGPHGEAPSGADGKAGFLAKAAPLPAPAAPLPAKAAPLPAKAAPVPARAAPLPAKSAPFPAKAAPLPRAFPPGASTTVSPVAKVSQSGKFAGLLAC